MIAGKFVSFKEQSGVASDRVTRLTCTTGVKGPCKRAMKNEPGTNKRALSAAVLSQKVIA